MNTTQSNVVGNKTARSCDSCSSKRAIWFCAADDAFLCQSCDTSVHSANQLARRHERVRLEKAPPSISSSSLAWHQGITKKLRTPRSRKRLQKQHDDGDDSNVEAVLVPEFTSEESFSPNDQNEEQYRVPVLDLLEEGEISNGFDVVIGKDSEFDLDSLLNEHEVSTMNLFPEFMETDVVELQDYLGTKTGEDSCKGLSSELGFEGGLKVEEDNYCNSLGLEMAAGESSNWDFEEETDFYGDPVGLEMTRDQSSNWDFEGDYSSSPPRVEEKEVREKEKRRINLKLNHDAIIYAWDCQDSPWMNGIKPDFNLFDDHCWFDFMGGGCTLIDEDPNGAKSGRSGSGPGSGSGSGRFDEEREARVLRYKEKRRTRLFAKKIRYQVRKLNAEKRPRMKGRFVKRSAMAAPSSSSLPCYMQMNKQTMI